MNSCSFIVKIVSKPTKHLIGDNIPVVKTFVQIAKIRKKKSFNQIQISLWGKVGKDFSKFYKVGDYILIKGILSFNKIKSGNRLRKKPNLTVLKLYPFILAV